MPHGGIELDPDLGDGDTGTGGPNEPLEPTAFEPAPPIPETGFQPSEPTGGTRPVGQEGRGRGRRGPDLRDRFLRDQLRARPDDFQPGLGVGRPETPLEFGERPTVEVSEAKKKLSDGGSSSTSDASTMEESGNDDDGAPLAGPGQVVDELRQLFRGERAKLSPEVTRSASVAGLVTAFTLGGG